MSCGRLAVASQSCCYRFSGIHSCCQFPKQCVLTVIVTTWCWFIVDKVVSSVSGNFGDPYRTRVPRSSIFCMCISTVGIPFVFCWCGCQQPQCVDRLAQSFPWTTYIGFTFPFETSIFLVNTVHAQSETFSRDLVQRRDVLQRSCPCVQIAYRELVQRSFIEISKAILARDRRDPAGDPPQRSCQDYRDLVQRSCQETSHRDIIQGDRDLLPRSCQEFLNKQKPCEEILYKDLLQTYRYLAKRPLQENLYRDLAKRPLIETMYTGWFLGGVSVVSWWCLGGCLLVSVYVCLCALIMKLISRKCKNLLLRLYATWDHGHHGIFSRSLLARGWSLGRRGQAARCWRPGLIYITWLMYWN